MSIATEIQRLQNDKIAIKEALQNKGVEVSDSDGFDEFAARIDEISGVRNFNRTISVNPIPGRYVYQIPEGYTGHGIITLEINEDFPVNCNPITLTVNADNNQEAFTTKDIKLKLYNNSTLLYTWTFNNTSASAGNPAIITSNEEADGLNLNFLDNFLTLVVEGGVTFSGGDPAYSLITIPATTFFGKIISATKSANRTINIGNVRSEDSSSPVTMSITFINEEPD